MLEQLRAWLNGTRDYSPGVFLYNQLGNNNGLKTLFQKGKTDYCNKRLQTELLEICIELKSKKNGTQKLSTTAPAEKRRKETKRVFTTSVNANPELYAACKNEADKLFKETMNARAVLFSMVPSELYEDPNRPDLVEARSKLSVSVVKGYNQASSLYDRADYVRINGKLPDDPTPAAENLDKLPDHLVKQKLDNLRKNYNKMKDREHTPERIALMQKHAADILKLETRWHSLQPKK